ncbi:MAG TPA: hypothetical protein PKD24_15195 [Pyrinomonadaceae bacterium]|nr:hypothetical protein [Pyrinomonadaceae bacterium]HMP66740.1 hypothetical protein [Pyrinomonadaceae bacterium]
MTIKKKAGGCAANTDLEEIKAAVQLSKKRIDQALYVGTIAQGKSGVFEKLSEANKGLGKVGESLEKVQDICLDIKAVGKIHAAAVALSDERLIYDDPNGAAAAFDSMFQGFGRLCRYLPPPAKAWQQFFENFNLFGNLTPKLIPQQRWKDQFSQIEGW